MVALLDRSVSREAALDRADAQAARSSAGITRKG
jgi:hypothetical protein